MHPNVLLLYLLFSALRTGDMRWQAGGRTQGGERHSDRTTAEHLSKKSSFTEQEELLSFLSLPPIPPQEVRFPLLTFHHSTPQPPPINSLPSPLWPQTATPSPSPTRMYVQTSRVPGVRSANSPQLLEDSLLDTDPEIAEIMVNIVTASPIDTSLIHFL